MLSLYRPRFLGQTKPTLRAYPYLPPLWGVSLVNWPPWSALKALACYLEMVEVVTLLCEIIWGIFGGNTTY